MASAQGLLGLMNQLQNMESSVTNILMEAAMKLSALTDANIFVLVENQEGRRFSGKPHLCDAYVNGGLHATGNDVEFEVNHSVSALQEKRITSQNSLQSLERLSMGPKQGLQRPGHSFPVLNSRPMHSNPPRPQMYNRKRPLQTIADRYQPLKQFKPSSPQAKGLSLGEEVNVKDEFNFKPEETNDTNCQGQENDESELGQQEAIHSEEDSDIAEVTEEIPQTTENNLFRPDEAGPGDEYDEGPKTSREGFGDFNWNGTSGACVPYNPVGAVNPQMDFVNDIYPQSLLEKLEAIDAFDVDVIFDPKAAPRKILNSILHEVGSKLAFSCPFWPRQLSNPQLKEFLVTNIEVFLGKFPVIRRICNDRDKVYIGKKCMSKLTYIKNNIRSSYDKQFK